MIKKCVAAICAIVGVAAGGVTPAAAAPSPPASCPTGIGSTMRLVNDYWQSHNPVPASRDWTVGTYFTGDMAAADALGDQPYLEYAARWARAQRFALDGGPTTSDANSQAAAQTYIQLYQHDPAHPAADLTQIRQSVRTMVNRPAVNEWWWVDALFMAMPAFAELAQVDNSPADLAKLYGLFHDTKQTRGLWNPAVGLWWRDGTFVGKNVYWSRGNGWAAAALARTLEVLPATDQHRAEYVQTLRQMAAALKALQQPSGFWYVSLRDPSQFPGPETSGTALFTYAIAWGINHGVLDAATYTPVVTRAWQAMAGTSVHSDGFLGYVQPVGSAPAKAPAGSTANYGVGAFLLAGSQLGQLCGL
ncbi:glycoside hydrolase family 88 protein [Kutzneria buriramensis]|uniref:Rhamnogalacturonyl hydrolase YesR n=1 Tax=Kutzneria buriramensis TaxID=1045776 RepID=A0A3E0HHL9_9PSEU|nr:glycoside hydrolase family 88 protein [Kutzneria buriramensis]REH45870.1 rhamnogalacturonyl hydrolase YesR [Kutzneria buriramensis]